MGAFDEQFNISASQNPQSVAESAMDLRSGFFPNLTALVGQMKEDLENRGLRVDEKRGPLNNDGTLSLIFALSDMPSAVLRMGESDNPPESAIVLRAAARLVYRDKESADNYQTHVLPFAPDIGKVTPGDILNTLRVLKAEGNLEKMADIGADPEKLSGQFVFLKSESGDLLRYPADCPDRSMAGAPIAFIRDLNAIQSEAESIEKFGSTGNAEEFLSAFGVKLEELSPAPQECVDACRQQDAITGKIREELKAKGVQLNGPG